MATTRRLVLLTGASAAALIATAIPGASAAPSAAQGGVVGSSAVAKACNFKAQGEKLRIEVGMYLGSNGRDVEAVQIRATDNDESGSLDNNDVRIKKIRLTIKDQDGKTQVNNTVSPSSPGSYDIGSAGEGAGKVTVKVRWRTHGKTVNASCSKVID